MRFGSCQCKWLLRDMSTPCKILMKYCTMSHTKSPIQFIWAGFVHNVIMMLLVITSLAAIYFFETSNTCPVRISNCEIWHSDRYGYWFNQEYIIEILFYSPFYYNIILLFNKTCQLFSLSSYATLNHFTTTLLYNLSRLLTYIVTLYHNYYTPYLIELLETW